MSIKVMTWYWDNSEQDGHKLLLLLALSDWSDNEGQCYPSTRGLAQRIRRDRRSVQRAIKELEKAGEILIHQGMGKGPEGQRSSLFSLLKYREALAIETPPMLIEAANHYRERSRRQGRKGAEVRKAQAKLLEAEQGVTPTSPPTVGTDVTPTGGTDVTQIRQYDPSVDPSEKSASGSPSRDRDAPPTQPTATHARAVALAESESFDGPATAGTATAKPSRSKPVPSSPRFEGRKFVKGMIPVDTGTTPVEVYYESFSINGNDTKLTDLDEDDLTRLCPDLDRLRAVCVEYRRSSYRKGDMQLILDWYRDPSRLPSNRHRTHVNGSAPAAVKPITETTLKDWLLRTYHMDHLPGVIRATQKTETEIRNEYKQWRVANGLPPG